MAITLEWLASRPASCFHALEALLVGQALVDTQVREALSPIAEHLGGSLSELGLRPQQFFLHAIPLSARGENPATVARIAATKALGVQNSEKAAALLAGPLAAAEAAFKSAAPDLMEQLELRSGPLREQWEARGPGLWSTLGRMTDPKLLVDNALVLLVHPVLGGAGAAHPPYNSVRIEAVLTNPTPELPEVMRLAWLLAMLNLDLPVFQEALHRDRLTRIAPLALVPCVLAAAEEVELSHCDVPQVSLALSAWRLVDSQDTSFQDPNSQNQVAEKLIDWWSVYSNSRPAFPVALKALDQMLS